MVIFHFCRAMEPILVSIIMDSRVDEGHRLLIRNIIIAIITLHPSLVPHDTDLLDCLMHMRSPSVDHGRVSPR